MNKPRLGLYAGSFDPFHVGHLDIVQQAVGIFDKVMIAKGVNGEKIVPGRTEHRYPLPDKFLVQFYRGLVEVMNYDGLLIDIVRKLEEQYDVTIVRGLRNGADLEYEQNMVAFLKNMYPQAKILAFYCSPANRHVSSSSIRRLETIAPDEFKKYAILD